MSAHVDISIGCEGLAISEDRACELADLVLASEGVDRECMVSLSVVDDETMRGLNHEWRGIDRATDVLSLECERPDDPDLGVGETCELGDIVLAPDFIGRQADRVDVTPEGETSLLLIHGMLHLLGYDHESDEEAEVMEAREDAILAEAGLGDSVVVPPSPRHAEEGS
ncbi:MAG: rRNA maturation RNase YbeY [Atopobiaceae bacterium]|jgi:probable rRNA maturation factor|nr:rRNA maturation RNase YbeY [Atopobiaceae bacterium]MCI2173254.1 rRNA maturation RNase YbeY [Atopobiaceae bacterium]MCI2207249.1 rRNA maturation RNase YbeY [Atopobiaceae bacterium]